MKRQYLMYTTVLAVITGSILCFTLVFSQSTIRREIGLTFDKIEIQTSHQGDLVPPAFADEEDDFNVNRNNELSQVKQLDEVYYSDTIGSYLVLTRQQEFFEINGNGSRINQRLELSDEGQPYLLADFVGMRMVGTDRLYAITANGIFVTLENKDGTWEELPRQKIEGLTQSDRIFGLSYDETTKTFQVMNRSTETEQVELMTLEAIEETKASDQANEERADKTEPNQPNNPVEPTEDVAAEREEKTPVTYNVTKRVELKADSMNKTVQAKFEKMRGIGLIERQGRFYVLDSKELVLYTINPEAKTINGQMVTPRVYGAACTFLQDNSITAVVQSRVFDLDDFVSVD